MVLRTFRSRSEQRLCKTLLSPRLVAGMCCSKHTLCLLLLAQLAWVTTLPAADRVPSFAQEVMPVLSKSGCNMGACHGNLNGKGGFKLSLRGEDPKYDHQAIVRALLGRRVNVLDPAASLLLQKPAGALAHQGGVRFRRDSQEYQLLSDWIAAGAPGVREESALVALDVQPRQVVLFAPDDRVQLRAIAHFADGHQRDVTSMCCYETSNLVASVDRHGLALRASAGETTVLVRFLNQQVAVRIAFMPAQTDFVWQGPPPRNYIDAQIFAKLQALRMHPSPLAADTVFVRRAYLDAIGLLPTAEEARSYVADTRPDKRERLIDDLLSRPEFAEHWALKWSDLLRNEEKVLDKRGVEVFTRWIRQNLAANRPLNEFVRELVAARGSTYENPPANYYRANRDPTTRAETTARLFLGARLQCARCHNHPFDRWTQDDYYAWSALFARVDYKIVENKQRDNLDKHEFNGEQIVLVKDEGEFKNARTGQNAVPKFLGADTPMMDAKADRLEPLAVWLTSGDNRLFVQSQVNFVWYHLLGRGLIEPIDDVRPTNPASHPELMDALGADFVASGFDLRKLMRTIMTSQTYALDAAPNETNRDDALNYSKALVKRWPAEKLLDAQCQVLDMPARFADQERGLRAGQLAGVPMGKRKSEDGDRFLKTFGKPERLLACECERSNETTLGQALVLIGGEGLQQRLTSDKNRLAKWAKSEQSPASIVDELYWTALSRPPSEAELAQGVQLLASDSDRFAALQDLAWALLNAKEFVFRR